MRNLRDFIIKLKSKIDVDLLGVVKANSMSHIKEKLINNRKLGFSTEFESDNLDSRLDPNFHLENAKSIFVIGMSYYWEDKEIGKYKISNHAQGLDYHKVLGERLENLKTELSKNFCFNSYLQVDSGDLYEKELGRLAGFGYIGKNSLLINEEFGSYIFLGILITDIELEEYSKEFVGSCEDCNLCKIACPSGSIKGDYTVDSRVCHSYLTQWKKEIPETKNIKYAYGCDICQRICPKNKGVKKNLREEFKPRLKNFDEIDVKNVSNREFKRQFKDFSFSWTGKKVIVRNIELIENRG